MNSYVIKQTQKQTELAVKLHQNCEIDRIRLARSKVTAERPQDVLASPINLDIKIKSRNVSGPEGTLPLEISFRLIGNQKHGDGVGKCALLIECVFEILYQLKPGFAPDESQIEAFKDGNAIFNCWPYCRQFVHEMLANMGFPPYTLPFLRVVTVGDRVKRRRSTLALT